jgi:hypothetical protein
MLNVVMKGFVGVIQCRLLSVAAVMCSRFPEVDIAAVTGCSAIYSEEC